MIEQLMFSSSIAKNQTEFGPLNFPGTHPEHALIFVAANEPAAHDMHAVKPNCEKDPPAPKTHEHQSIKMILTISTRLAATSCL